MTTKIAFFNARGLHGKVEEIRLFAVSSHIDITFIAETWLRPNTPSPLPNTIINITNPIPQRTRHQGRQVTGGILCFISSRFKDKVRIIFQDPRRYFVVALVGDSLVAAAYLVPTAPHTELNRILDVIEDLCTEMHCDCIMVGDLNARSTQITGDHATNERGRYLEALLQDRQFFYQPPMTGKYTTFHRGGHGIPDIVLSTGPAVRDLIIHETCSLGGSDHRPLTFSTPSLRRPTKQFERYHVRRLAEPDVRQKYREALHYHQAMLKPIHVGPLPLSQEDIEQTWQSIKEWIDRSAKESCGMLRPADAVDTKFWTRALHQERQRLEEATFDLQQVIKSNHPNAIRQAATREITKMTAEYRAKLATRRAEVHTEFATDISSPQNHGAFLRMVSCRKSRLTRSANALDPEKVAEYEAHFLSTFGGAPLGNYIPPAGTPSGLMPHNDSDVSITAQEVLNQLKRISLGKAAGCDGIMAELLAYGGDLMAQVLSQFFTALYRIAYVPLEWRKALIVPVYKKKGSATEIQNYRPIALTCVCRRVYERILLRDVAPFVHLLSDSQGGFRTTRSTLDQIFVLQEVITQHPGILNAFLDLQAAYDLVDRRLLWQDLASVYCMPCNTICRLQALFDSNRSFLVIAGNKGEGIENVRGLLQGSSLSPILFNFFINSLCRRLSAPNLPRVVTGPVKTNCLFFADDANLHAESVEDLRVLLKTCEQWSLEYGMRFSPSKCVLLGAAYQEANPLCLYNTALPTERTSVYLGIPFEVRGIDWQKLAKSRADKTKSIVAILASMGISANTWPVSSCIHVYRSFVRPVMEYGMALRPLPKKVLSVYQKTQNLALRTMLRAPRTTSVNAMHRLTLIETIQTRNAELNFRYAMRLASNTNLSIPAVRLWQHQYLSCPKNSLVQLLVRDNALWKAALPPGARTSRRLLTMARPMTSKEIRAARRQAVMALDNNCSNVAGTLQVEARDSLRHVLRPGPTDSSKHRKIILRWLLGLVAMHQPCRNCGGSNELSRKHAVFCTGIDFDIQNEYPDAPYATSTSTSIDTALNAYRNQPPEDQFYEVVARAIGKIFTRCLGYVERPNGFFAPDEDTSTSLIAPMPEQQSPVAETSPPRRSRGSRTVPATPFAPINRVRPRSRSPLQSLPPIETLRRSKRLRTLASYVEEENAGIG